MFNRTNVHVTPEVHVHQQPLDAADAARLYGEIRDKAEAEGMAAAVQKLGADNQIFMLKWQSQYDCQKDERTLRASISINGRVYNVEANTDELLAAAVNTMVASTLIMSMAQIVLGQPGRYRV